MREPPTLRPPQADVTSKLWEMSDMVKVLEVREQ